MSEEAGGKLTAEDLRQKTAEETEKAVKNALASDDDPELQVARKYDSEVDAGSRFKTDVKASKTVQTYEKAEEQYREQQNCTIRPEDLQKLTGEQIRAKMAAADASDDKDDFVPASPCASEYQMKELNQLVSVMPVHLNFLEAEKKLKATRKENEQ
ncbi:unnamed protein product, partial [Mesorhabditis spiculigera]